jgi:uncharacterized membrane protein
MKNQLHTTPHQHLQVTGRDSEINVSTTERVVSLLSGSLMLYNSLAKKKKNYPRALLSAYMIYRGASGHCPGYKLAGKTLEPPKVSNINIRFFVTVNKPVYFVYQNWRNLENLPSIMNHLENVTVIDDEISEWTVTIPGKIGQLKWKSAITKDIENREIHWRSFGEALIHNVGKVEFHDNGSFGTKMEVMISYRAPMAETGEMIGKVLNPIFANMIEQDVNRFKDFVENS